MKALSRTESLQYLEFQLEDFAEHFLNGVCLDFGCWYGGFTKATSSLCVFFVLYCDMQLYSCSLLGVLWSVS